MKKINNLFRELQEKFYVLARENDLLKEFVSVKGKVLSTQEAIGNPDRKDFPLMKGKEKLVQATFKGSIGQAYTDMPGSFEGILEGIINRPLESNFDRAVFIATLNAVLRYLGLIDATIHCKDNEPEYCASKLPQYIKEHYGEVKIALVGYQPAFLEELSKEFKVRVLDLDTDRFGTEKFGVKIEDGEKDLQEVLNWCDLIFATGSTLANGSIVTFINAEKPAVFYGTTVAGAAHLLNLNRFCQYAK